MIKIILRRIFALVFIPLVWVVFFPAIWLLYNDEGDEVVEDMKEFSGQLWNGFNYK